MVNHDVSPSQITIILRVSGTKFVILCVASRQFYGKLERKKSEWKYEEYGRYMPVQDEFIEAKKAHIPNTTFR